MGMVRLQFWLLFHRLQVADVQWRLPDLIYWFFHFSDFEISPIRFFEEKKLLENLMEYSPTVPILTSNKLVQ